MTPIGITGGLGSGKSTAAAFFNEKGDLLIDADQEAKAYISQSISIQSKIIKTFGKGEIAKHIQMTDEFFSKKTGNK